MLPSGIDATLEIVTSHSTVWREIGDFGLLHVPALQDAVSPLSMRDMLRKKAAWDE